MVCYSQGTCVAVILLARASCLLLNRYPISTRSGQKQPDNFDEILQVKAKLGKYLMEKYYSEHNQQLSIKYFAKAFLIS